MIKLHARKPFLFTAALAAIVAMVLFSFSFASEPEGDPDYDGHYFEDDNCYDIYNPMQLDRDGDGIGDVCEDEGFIVYPKKEEFVLCYMSEPEEQMPDDDGPPVPECETIIVNGNVEFSQIGSEGNDVYFDVYTLEEEGLHGYSDLLGDVELYLYGEGYYHEKFDGLDFPADAEISYYEWVLLADAREVCKLGGNDPDECDFEITEGETVIFYLNDTKYEYGRIKAFPPLYENPLCTNLPYPGEGGFAPMELIPGEVPFSFFGNMGLFYNCDEFGTPVLDQPATPNIATFLPGTSEPYTNLNTEVELHLNPLIPQFAPDYFFKLTGLSDITYTPTTNDFFGPPLDTIETEMVAMDLRGAIEDRPVGPDMDVSMKLITEDHPLWGYLDQTENPLLSTNRGVEFYTLDIVRILMTEFSFGYMDFFTETFPMVGAQSMFVYFEADLQDDGSVETLVPWDDEGNNVLPVIMTAYPGKKGIPPYYTTYCTYQNSYILEIFNNYGSSILGSEFMDYFNSNIPNLPIFRVMQDGEFTQSQIHIWDLELMCFELREEEVCDSVDNDLDGLVDEGPYNWLPGEDDDENWEVVKLYDFEDEAYGDGPENDYAYHSYQYETPPGNGPELYDINTPWIVEDEFNHNNEVCLEVQDPTTFHIYVDGVEVGEKHYQYYLETGEFDLSDSLPDANGDYKVTIVHVGDHAAHVDAVSLGENAPVEALLNGESILNEVSNEDNDVASVGGQEFVVEFNSTDNKVLSLVAREETQQSLDSNKAILLPGAGDQYYTHYLGDKSDFKAFLQPTSGHPEGAVYGNVTNDDEYLYIDLDITPDNTDDSGADYVTVTFKGSDKEYKVSDADSTYGELSFTYTDNVEYKHKVASVMIPLSEVSDVVEFKVEVYGTLSAAYEHYCQIAYSDGPDNNYPGDFRYWAQTDDTYSWNYNTQRFEFYVNDDVQEGDKLRVHWEGRAFGSDDTASVYVWNTASEDWDTVGSHSSIFDEVVEAFINPIDHINEGGYVNVVVQGDIYEEQIPQFVYNDLKATVLGDDDDDGPYIYSEMLYTDYVKLELLAEREGCKILGSRRVRPPSRPSSPPVTPEPILAADVVVNETCLNWMDDRIVDYEDSHEGEWTFPYVEFLSKVFIPGTPNHYILSGYGQHVDETIVDEQTRQNVAPGELTNRFHAVKMALTAMCIPPYTTIERFESVGDSYADLFRYADVRGLVHESFEGKSDEEKAEILNFMYKALDLGIMTGREKDDRYYADWDQPIKRVEILKLFVNAGNYDAGSIDWYDRVELEAFAAFHGILDPNDLTADQINEAAIAYFEPLYFDVANDTDDKWYLPYLPMVVKNQIVADVCLPNNFLSLDDNDVFKFRSDLLDTDNANRIRVLSQQYSCDDLKDPFRFAFPKNEATRGEVFALTTRMMYLLSGINKVNTHSGFNMFDPAWVTRIFTWFDGTERSEFLLGVIEQVEAILGYKLNLG